MQALSPKTDDTGLTQKLPAVEFGDRPPHYRRFLTPLAPDFAVTIQPLPETVRSEAVLYPKPPRPQGCYRVEPTPGRKANRRQRSPEINAGTGMAVPAFF